MAMTPFERRSQLILNILLGTGILLVAISTTWHQLQVLDIHEEAAQLYKDQHPQYSEQEWNPSVYPFPSGCWRCWLEHPPEELEASR